jgi:hypothetical protein
MRKKLLASGIILLLFIPLVSTEMNTSNTFDIPYQDGWPQKTTGQIVSSPVIADLDGDGTMEIIVGSGNAPGDKFKVYVFHSDGSIMDGWPVDLIDDVDSVPAIGDLDNDGDLEIVINDVWGYVYAFNHDGTMMDGWPKSIDFMTSPPTLYDLDNDGDLEVIAGSDEDVEDHTRSFAKVNIWHHDGTNFDGWPQLITDYHSSYIGYSSSAVGDIDNDGDVEIIVGISTSSTDQSEGFVYVWHHNGQLVNGWPVSVGKFNDVYSSPSLGDLDSDNDLEIIIGTGRGKILALHHDGTNLSGWPNDISCYCSPQALGDIDQDGMLEVVCGRIFGSASGTVYIWNNDGSQLEEWPQKTNGFVLDSPVIVDIAGDELLEIIVPCGDHKVHAWYQNGTPVPGFPLETGGSISSTPCLGDIDGDGDVELIVSSTDKKLYVWDLSHPYKKDLMEWPMFQHDLYHTGEFTFGRGFVAGANGPYNHWIYDEVEFVGSVMNGKPPYSWYWDFGDGNISTEKDPFHVYNELGDYIVNLTVTDSQGNSTYDTATVNISLYGKGENGALKIKSLSGGIGVTAVLENQGLIDAENVKWNIYVGNEYNMEKYFIFPIGNNRNGVVDIPAGKTRTIFCPVLVLGLFPVDIVVTASIDSCHVSESMTRNALFFLIFTTNTS